MVDYTLQTVSICRVPFGACQSIPPAWTNNRDERQKLRTNTDDFREFDDKPLNLSLKNESSFQRSTFPGRINVSIDTGNVKLVTMNGYHQTGVKLDPGTPTALDENNFLWSAGQTRHDNEQATAYVDPKSEPAVDGELSVDGYGNVFVVSDIGINIAQEEVVESDSSLDQPPIKCEPFSGSDSMDMSDDEEEDEFEEMESEYKQQVERKRLLTEKVDKLNRQIAKVRSLLEAEVRREKIVQPGITSTGSSISGDSNAEEGTPVQQGSKDDLRTDVGPLPAVKRIRNNSWPQMTANDSTARKKEQNKLASKRFRERKKMELEKAKLEIAELEAKNDALKLKAEKMQAQAGNLRKILIKMNLIKIVDIPVGNCAVQTV